jgi:hypothetical protein
MTNVWDMLNLQLQGTSLGVFESKNKPPVAVTLITTEQYPIKKIQVVSSTELKVTYDNNQEPDPKKLVRQKQISRTQPTDIVEYFDPISTYNIGIHLYKVNFFHTNRNYDELILRLGDVLFEEYKQRPTNPIHENVAQAILDLMQVWNEDCDHDERCKDNKPPGNKERIEALQVLKYFSKHPDELKNNRP